MKVVIHPIKKSLCGNIRIPSSKSHAQRAMALAMITQGTSHIKNIGQSLDEQAVLEIVRQVTNGIESIEDDTFISGINPAEIPGKNYFIGESGLATRMLTPILANSKNALTLTGKGSILTRPMNFFNSILPPLNVNFNSTNGKLPFQIQGPLTPKNITVDGSLSSQFITGILYGFVASPLLKNEVLQIENLASKPYFELSLDVLKSFGVDLEFRNNRIQFNGPYKPTPAAIQVEGDWSSASFLLVAGAIYGEISVSNLQLNSKQADSAILTALEKFGATIKWKNDTLTVSKNQLNGFHFDATDCPDLFPPLAILGAFGKDKSTIKGISRLTHKESNRALAIQQEFKKFGIDIQLDHENDLMIIYPVQVEHFKTTEATIHSHNDHRIAMAGAILALNANQPVTIDGAEAVNKSFVEFWGCLKELGVKIE